MLLQSTRNARIGGVACCILEALTAWLMPSSISKNYPFFIPQIIVFTNSQNSMRREKIDHLQEFPILQLEKRLGVTMWGLFFSQTCLSTLFIKRVEKFNYSGRLQKKRIHREKLWFEHINLLEKGNPHAWARFIKWCGAYFWAQRWGIGQLLGDEESE